MSSTALRQFEFRLETEAFDYRTPMKFGGRVVNDVTVLTAHCEVETESGSATGLGAMTMGVAWAWPDPMVDNSQKLAAVLKLSHRLVKQFAQVDPTGHPLQVCCRVAEQRASEAKSVANEMGLQTPIPELAILLAGAPLEAALFDAHGKAAGCSAWNLLDKQHLPVDLSEFLGNDFAGLHLSDFVSRQPVPSLPLYHLVGALDPLTSDEVETPVDDGLPETLGEWIERDGLTHLKFKLDGANLDWDVQRVKSIDRVARQTREIDWSYSLDFNERCHDEEYVLELLNQLEREQPGAFESIGYIEQPTHRDLTRPGQPTMHRVAKIRPVVIDESLTGIESLRLAIEQGYSGIALKACKGHAESLLLGAAAQHLNLYRCVQDLTCVGISLLHSASLAAHIPGITALESNGRQYAPAGNARQLDAFPQFFEIRNGQLPTAQLHGPGLGY